MNFGLNAHETFPYNYLRQQSSLCLKNERAFIVLEVTMMGGRRVGRFDTQVLQTSATYTGCKPRRPTISIDLYYILLRTAIKIYNQELSPCSHW